MLGKAWLYAGQSDSQSAETTRYKSAIWKGVKRGCIRTRNWVGRFDVCGVLSEDDGEASGQVEVDVTVEEPRAWVVRL